jgi:hypothetical protein
VWRIALKLFSFLGNPATSSEKMGDAIVTITAPTKASKARLSPHHQVQSAVDLLFATGHSFQVLCSKMP